MLGQD
ncbi:hypothetical protein BpHYR1_047579 [Brachionus plicatilis]